MKKQRCCYCRLIHLAATFRMLHRTNLCWNGNDCGGQYLPGRMMMGGRHHGHFFQIFQSYPVLPQQQRLRRTRRGKAFAPKISLLRTKFDGKGRVTFGKRGANKFFCIQYWWLLLILVISMRDLVSAAEVFLSFGACMPKCQRSTSRLMIIADDSITCRAMTIAAHRYARTKMCKAANSKEFEVSETPDSRVWD